MVLNCGCKFSVGPRLLMFEDVVDSLLVDGMLVMRKGVEANSGVVGIKIVVVVNTFDAGAVAVDPRDVVVDSAVFKRCGVVEEYSSTTRFKFDVVDPGLLMLKEVVDSLIVERMLVMRKGVEPNSWVVGCKSIVVDVLTEDNEDRR